MGHRFIGIKATFLAAVHAAIHSQPIFLFKDYAGTCDTIATTWVNDENTVGNMMHIVGGITTSMTVMTGVSNSFCTPRGIPFLSIGFNDGDSYKTHFFKE